MRQRFVWIVLNALIFALATPALADEEGASAEGSASLDDAELTGTAKWFREFPPERNMWELGGYFGFIRPSKAHELFTPVSGRANQGHETFRDIAIDAGVRLGYYPLEHFGIEAEGGLMPTEVERTSENATLYTIRGHFVGQLGLRSVVPFIVVGGGILGETSDTTVLGDDADPAFHWGIGVKSYVTKNWMARLDGRDIISSAQGVGGGSAHHWELLLGVAYTLGRSEPEKYAPPPPDDIDRDGFLDKDDACPTEPGVEPDGCPIQDRDRDGVLDADDKCPDKAGDKPEGCPPPDRDQDGVPDEFDICPDVAGEADNNGCPGDADEDGIADHEDKCPELAETDNGFQDQDGCPDELPDAVKEFTGVMEGIYFSIGKSVIKPTSFKTLAAAAEVLKEYEMLRVEISGHTDNTGSEELNKSLSLDRARAVKEFMVAHGIADDRIKARGMGSSDPVDDNDTAAGRSKNRRIEFKVLK